MPDTIIRNGLRGGAIAAASVVMALGTAAPAAAENVTDDLTLGGIIPTDAIRIEVAPGQLGDCAPLFAWAFALPPASAGFGPLLPEVPVGYGPTCTVIPDTAASAASYSLPVTR